MHATQRIFVPAARLELVLGPLREALTAAGCRLGLDRPRPVLRLEELACLDMAAMGSSWRIRTPYVYPLLATTPGLAFPEAKGKPLEWVSGADWVLLGGKVEHFAAMAAEAFAARGVQDVRLAPYMSLAGELPQKPRPTDVTVNLRKTWHFVNHVAVRSIMGQLLELPEERWGETGYVAVNDHIGVFWPHIEKYLAKPPSLVIELGCGLGQTTRSLARLFPQAKVVGLDVSQESLTVARQKFDMPNLEFKPFDFANRFAFEDASVDLVVSSSALNISENQARTAAETLRVLAPDGLLVNGCIFEPFHTFWDFPTSAFRLSRSNLILADWRRAAARKGFNLALTHWTTANSPHYFASRCLDGFDALYREMLAQTVHDPFSPYEYTQCTAVMTAGANVPADPGLRVPPAGHLQAVQEILQAYARATDTVRELAEMNWLTQAALARLYPEALDYLCACLPGAAGIITHALPKDIMNQTRLYAA